MIKALLTHLSSFNIWRQGSSPSHLNRLLAGVVLLILAGTVMADSLEIQTGHSALWHNPERSGEGWMLEILDEASANVYWYTYDDAGNQRWLTGQGLIDGGSIVFPEMLITSGGRFGAEFDPDAVVRQVVGELRLHFDDCTTGRAEYDMFDQSGSITIERLSATMATSCPPFSNSPSKSQGAHSGSWFDPAHSGEGFSLQWMDRGQALVTWFSYDTEGNQYWMIGVGELDDQRRLVFGLHATQGGRFGDAFDSGDVELIEWGSLSMDLGCLNGTIEYQSLLPEFGSGEHDVVRLTALAGLECPFFMPEVGAIKDARWDSRFTTAGLNGSYPIELDEATFPNVPAVYDLLPLADGNVLAAGSFGWFGQTMVPPLVQGSAESGQWQAYEPAIEVATLAATALAKNDSQPLAMAVTEPGRILLVDGSELQIIGHYDGLVRRLAWFDGQLWVAGVFNIDGDGPANLAVWDGQSWQTPPGGAVDDAVFAFEVSDQGLYIGGQFNHIGGIEAQGVALWNGQDWQAFDQPETVYAIASTPDALYAAGSRFGAARWNGSEWVALGDGLSDGSSLPVVSDIHAFQGQLYAIGCFLFANGGPNDEGSVPARGIARWNGQAWESLDDGSAGGVRSAYFNAQSFLACSNQWNPRWIWSVLTMQRLASYGDYLYVGGSFAGIDGQPSQSLIAFDGERFLTQGQARLGLNGPANRLVMGPDQSLYAYGPTHFGSTPSSGGLFRLDASGWTEITPPFPPSTNVIPPMSCSPVVAGDERIFLGCFDRSVNWDPDQWRARVFYLGDGGSWLEIETDDDFRTLQSITVDPQGNVWIAGGGPGFNPTGYIARLDGDQFYVFEDGFDHVVSELAFTPDSSSQDQVSFIARGTFRNIDNQPFDYLAHWIDGQWHPLGALEQAPLAISYRPNRILISTEGASNVTDNLTLASWDGEDWIELATPENGFPDFSDESVGFNLIHQIGDRIILAGEMLPGYPYGTGNVFIHEAGSFGLLAGGLAGRVPQTMVISADAIIFGGYIVEADSDGQPVSTLGIARLTWD